MKSSSLVVLLVCAMVCGSGKSIQAQDVPDQSDNQPAPSEHNDRIFGVLPNYSTVEGASHVQPVSLRQKFRMAELNSFDPYVFPFLGVVAGLGIGGGSADYAQRYVTALADNTVGNFMTTAVLPGAFHQDPRYFELGQGSVWHRTGYALSRVAVTRGRSGTSQFNVSEMGGTLLAAGASNLYYPAADQSIASTLTRWGTQVLWDTLSNQLKEFWPDIRRELRKH